MLSFWFDVQCVRSIGRVRCARVLRKYRQQLSFLLARLFESFFLLSIMYMRAQAQLATPFRSSSLRNQHKACDTLVFLFLFLFFFWHTPFFVSARWTFCTRFCMWLDTNANKKKIPKEHPSETMSLNTKNTQVMSSREGTNTSYPTHSQITRIASRMATCPAGTSLTLCTASWSCSGCSAASGSSPCGTACTWAMSRAFPFSWPPLSSAILWWVLAR